MRPSIFISAVSKELGSARQLVANTLQFLGYEPVWQDIFGTEQGDLRDMLRKKIDACQGVVQIVGQCYGAEPPAADEQFGRVSYTQFETCYARQRGKKVWFLVLDETFSADPHAAEPEVLRALQAAYRQSIQSDRHLFHPLGSREALEANVLKMKDELASLRRGAKRWASAVTALLVLTLVLVACVLIAVVKPPHPEAMTEQRADSAFVSRSYAAAFDAYRQLSDATPTNISYHRRIEECSRLGRLQKPLLDYYLARVQQQPSNAIFHNYLGNAFLLVDPCDTDGKAQANYEAALRLDPKLSLPLANLGILAYRAGRTDEALSLFQRYLTAFPEDAQGWVNLGMLCTALFDANTNNVPLASQAEQAFHRALRAEPGLASAYKGLGRISVTVGRTAEALNAYQRSLALNYDQPEVRQQVELLAWESQGARNPALQSDDLKTRAATGDDSKEPFFVAVARLLNQQRYREAKDFCQKWIMREPGNPLAFCMLARACDGEGQPDSARKARAEANRLIAPQAHSP